MKTKRRHVCRVAFLIAILRSEDDQNFYLDLQSGASFSQVSLVRKLIRFVRIQSPQRSHFF